MAERVQRMRIGGLTRLEQLELVDALPGESATAQVEVSLGGGLHGDLGTWQVVIEAYAPTLPLVAAWLLKRRRKSVVRVDVETLDGARWERRSIQIETSEQSAPDADVLRQLTGLLNESEPPGPGA